MLRSTIAVLTLALLGTSACSSRRTSDPCAGNPCDPNATCERGAAGYTCTCDAGFAGDGLTCEPVFYRSLHATLDYQQRPEGFASMRAFGTPTRLVGMGRVAADETPHLVFVDPTTSAITDVLGGPVRDVFHAAASDVSFYVDAAGELYRLDLVTAARTKLSRDERLDTHWGSWWLSPDETQLVYLARTDPAENRDLFLVNSDGTGHANLSAGLVGQRVSEYGYSDTSNRGRPRVLPDGSRVVFLAAPETGDQPLDLYSVKVDGSGLVRLNGALAEGASVSASNGRYHFSFALSPDSTRVVYVSDEETVGTKELFAVDPDGGNRVKLSGSMAAGGGVSIGHSQESAQIAPDGGRVAFFADREVAGKVELYSVRLDGSDLLKLSNGLTVGASVLGITADGTQVVFASSHAFHVAPVSGGIVVDLPAAEAIVPRGAMLLPSGGKLVYQTTPAARKQRLWVVNLDGTGNTALGAPVDSLGERYLTPDEARVVYGAHEDAEDDYAFHVVSIAGGEAKRINPPKLSPQSAGGRVLWLDHERVYFGYDQNTWTFEELFVYDFAAESVTNLSDRMPLRVTEDVDEGALHESADGRFLAFATSHHFPSISKALRIVDRVTGGECRIALPVTAGSRFLADMPANAFFSPDGQSFYVTYWDSDGPWTFYRVDTITCAYRQVHGTPPEGGRVHRMRLAPDQSKLVFSGEQNDDVYTALYSINPDGSGLTKLSTDAADRDVIDVSNEGSFAITPDSSRVVYWAEQDTDGVMELYSVRMDGSEQVKLNGPVAAGGAVYYSGFCFAPKMTPDSQYVVYSAAQADAPGWNLYRSTMDGGENIRLNDGTGSVITGVYEGCDAFKLTPDGQRVVYVARGGNTYGELFAVGLDGTGHVKLSGAMVEHGRVNLNFVVTPDSAAVVYTAREEGTDRSQLYAVDIGGQNHRKIGDTLEGDRLNDFQLDRGGTRAVYVVSRADSQPTVYAARVDGSGKSVVAVGSFDHDFLLTDDDRVILLHGEVDRAYHPYMVPLAGGEAVDLFPPTLASYATTARLSKDGQRVYVVADLRTSGVFELFEVRLP
jgi:Tol biopolymer transport system component